MADIKLVIKIPEDVFKRTVFYREFRDLNDCVITLKALEKAIPLPKGHGRLIDADEIQFENTEFDTYGDYCIAFDAIDEAEPIIEADKAESEDKNGSSSIHAD